MDERTISMLEGRKGQKNNNLAKPHLKRFTHAGMVEEPFRKS